MLKYKKINNVTIMYPFLKKGVAIAYPPLKEVREQAQRSMCIGGMLIISKLQNNSLVLISSF